MIKFNYYYYYSIWICL